MSKDIRCALRAGHYGRHLPVSTTAATPMLGECPVVIDLMAALKESLRGGDAESVNRAAVTHALDCVCPRCLDEMFGPPGALPPDFEEQMEARTGDTGIRTVGPDR